LFGIGWTELIVIALILLVFVGPRHLPALLRKLGSITADLRSASREFRNQIEVEVRDLESPAGIVGSIEREVAGKVSSPYEEARRLDREVRGDLEKTIEGRDEADDGRTGYTGSGPEEEIDADPEDRGSEGGQVEQ